MSSRTPRNPEIIFFLLAIVVIMGGYALIIDTENVIDGAAVAKTGKTSTPAPTGKAYTAPVNETTSTNDSSPSSGTASYSPNQSGNSMYQESPSYAYSMPSENQSAQSESSPNQTSTSNESSQNSNETVLPQHQIRNESTPLVSSQVDSTLPPVQSSTEKKLILNVNIIPLSGQMPQIILNISNPTSRIIVLKPTLQELSPSLPDEAAVIKILTQELAQQHQLYSPFEVQERLEILRILEKEKVTPLHVRKVYHPFDSMTAALTYTKKRTSGQLLRLPLLSTIEVLPQEQKQVNIVIPPTLSAVGRDTLFAITVNGKTDYNTTFSLLPSFSTAIDVNPATQNMDIYLSIPQNNPGEYFLEVKIGKVYYELFGPYVIGSESALFSQQFAYSFKGSQPVTLTIIKDGQEVQKIEQEAEFSEGKI
ncbi:MAG: hypothetical protein Q7K45_05250 [Nanoarchaeota archaeon]|nr:hypothetical protein [Nanoarchaeota archaeon]